MVNWTLKPLPIQVELETKKVLKRLPKAHAALAELKGIAQTIPNQNILINTLGLQEAKDSLTCSQKWINDYQLFSMVKDLGKHGKFNDGSCLYEFMEGVDSTRMQVFYTVDSLFNSLDSTLSVQLDSAFDTESDSSNDSLRWSTIQILFDEVTTEKTAGLEGTLN